MCGINYDLVKVIIDGIVLSVPFFATLFIIRYMNKNLND